MADRGEWSITQVPWQHPWRAIDSGAEADDLIDAVRERLPADHRLVQTDFWPIAHRVDGLVVLARVLDADPPIAVIDLREEMVRLSWYSALRSWAETRLPHDVATAGGE